MADVQIRPVRAFESEGGVDGPKPMLILTILDESGSMGDKRSDVIGGFNTFLGDQQAQPGDCRMAIVKFNTVWSVLTKITPLAEIAPLTQKTYTPGGGTALFDAIAEGVRLADADKQPDERVLCLIVTDGEENASKETTQAQLLAIIKEREARGDWTFTYMGADPSKFAREGYVSSVSNSARYDPAAPAVAFASVSRATSGLRGQSVGRTDSFYADPPPPPVEAKAKDKDKPAEK